MKLRCIIVDDEPGAQYVLENYIGQLGYAELSGKFYNAVDAYHFMRDNEVDVLLVDINMPQIDGFGLLDMVAHKPAIIFTTAYSEHALKSFDYGAIDYLLKPIRFERFVKAMEKAQKWRGVEPVVAGDELETIEVKSEGRIRSVKVADIRYIESLRNYLKIYLADRSLLVLMTMNELESKLPRSLFIRIHKSFLVNVSKIVQAKTETVNVLDTSLPVGKTYKKYFEEFLKAFESK